MAFEATTDGEKMIQLAGNIEKLDSKIDTVCESLDKVVEALEKLETTRVSDHEMRITKIEKWQAEWAGAYKLIAIAGLLLGAFALLIQLKSKL